MRKLNKKFLALLLVAVLAIGTVMSALASSSYEVADAEWWDGNAGAEVALSSTETSVVYTIDVQSDITDWGIEIYDSDGKYISAFSYAGCWYYGATGDDLVGVDEVTALSSLPQGTYTVVVTRDGADFTIVYYDTDGTTVLATLTATNTDIGETAYTHFYAQYGSFSVSGVEVPVSADDEAEEDTTAATEEDTTTAAEDETTTEAGEEETTATSTDSEETTTEAEDETTVVEEETTTEAEDETTVVEDEITTTAVAEDETTTETEDETTTTTTSADVESNQIVVTETVQTGTTTETQEVEVTESGTDDDVTIETGFSAHTGELTISGDFDLTYYFTNTGDLEDANENYYNFILEMHTADTVGVDADGNAAYVYIDVRSDNYGWLANQTDGAELTFGDGAEDWATWLELMKSGTEVEVNVVRSGNTFTINWIMGKGDYYFSATVTCDDFEGQDVVVYLTGEQCTISDLSYTYTYTTTEEVEVPVYSTTTTTYTITDQVDVAIDSVELTATNTDADVDVNFKSYELSEDELAALADIYGGTLVNVYDVYLTYAGTEEVYTLADGESVQIKFYVSSESEYANVLLLHYNEAEGAWEVIIPDEVGDDGYILATFTSLSPVAIIAGTITVSTDTEEETTTVAEDETTTVAEDETTTVAEGDTTTTASEDESTATSTDGDSASTGGSSLQTGDIATWMYFVLIAGAAAVCVVLAKKRVTE